MTLQRNFDLGLYKKKFLRHLRRKNYSLETLVGYEKDLDKFSLFLIEIYQGVILVEEITKNDILDYMDFLKDKEGYKINSISRHLSTLKSFFKFLTQELDFTENPAMKVKTPKSYTPLPQILSFKEVQLLLNETKKYSSFYHVLFSFIYYTGTRITPARTLLVENVNVAEKKVYFPYIKGGKDLHLPLHPILADLLEAHLEKIRHNGSNYVFESPKLQNRPISAGDVRINLRKMSKICGITKRVTPHILRHSVATHLTLLGVDQAFIAAILGHVDLRSTSRYQHLVVDNLRPALEKLH
ncbi:tyrosine-type recombinase/integrase [Neobacillus sp. PS3-40]|uniref:tyrosine-type recombinase/integrase n=1 Tax=Neobacillus sp. PS3-40 TaxID=3070679 RepID=UPI0027E12624|nr:tyrosine-type recombinase/integrase [Neobacillus sp. PS3-40]WML46167.1 tyrosine-type recombinase/integrase [Neobacillus sp. PS3-40]